MSTQLAQARELAQRLCSQNVDVNEVEKILAYARAVRRMDHVQQVVRRLAEQNVIIYSHRTKYYARAIRDIVLPSLPADMGQALELLGWTVRLMRYERAISGGSRRGRR